MATSVVYTSQQGDTVDLICWKHYGHTKDVTEQVLDVNPGLAALGPVLPLGTKLNMPVVERVTETPRVLKLWD